MAVTDPVADMLTRVRNAVTAKHDAVSFPSSKMKVEIAEILKKEGFIAAYEVNGDKPKQQMKITLKYDERGKSIISGLERVSKPGMRVYVQRGDIPRVYGGLGIAMVSTSRGLMTGSHAYHRGIGGEFICKVW